MNGKSACVAFLISLLLTGRGASAEPSAADRATARALAQEGQQAYEAKKYEVAADKFARADALVHAPTLLLGLAHAQVGLGEFVEAQESYNRIIREGVVPGSPRSWFKALEDATKEIDSIAPHISWVTISVRGPSNPDVVVDGASVPAASLGVKRPINPGNHTIKVSAEGYAPAEKSFALGEGQANAFTLDLVPSPTAPNAPLATRTSADSLGPADIPAAARRSKTPAYIALGIGGAGLVVGGITGLIAWKKFQKLDEVCPQKQCPPSQESAVTSYHTVGAISGVSLIAGLVGVGAGVVLLVTAPKEAAPADKVATGVSPFVGYGSAGVRGVF